MVALALILVPALVAAQTPPSPSPSPSPSPFSDWIPVDNPGECTWPGGTDPKPMPVQTQTNQPGITFDVCMEWFRDGCPNSVWPGDPKQPDGCFPGSNALAVQPGFMCRAYVSNGVVPTGNGLDDWQCYYNFNLRMDYTGGVIPAPDSSKVTIAAAQAPSPSLSSPSPSALPDYPEFGHADRTGDCKWPAGTNPKPAPVQTVSDSSIRLQDCEEWFFNGCPNNVWPGDSKQPASCSPGANALAVQPGGMCRAYVSNDEPPTGNGLPNWDCYYNLAYPDSAKATIAV